MAGLWIEPLDLCDHVGEVFQVDTDLTAKCLQVVLGEQRQRIQELCHQRIVAILILELQRQAFPEVAGADADGIECLQDANDSLDMW